MEIIPPPRGGRYLYEIWSSLCSAVRPRLSGSAKRVGLCHCMTCRKEISGPFKHFAVFAESAVEITGPTTHWTGVKTTIGAAVTQPGVTAGPYARQGS